MDDELRKILNDNNLDDCIAIFERHKLLDIDTVSDLNESDLEKIGISALGDRKKILRVFSVNIKTPISYNEPSLNPQKIVVQHAAMKGDDVSTGFGKGFGETVGKKTGGCVWSIGIIVIIVIVIATIIGSL